MQRSTLIRKLLKILMGGYLIFLVVEQMVLLQRSDISLKAPQEIKIGNEKVPVYLVSFADGPPVFRANQKAQAFSALDKGFSRIFMYSKADYEPSFYEKNKFILDQKKGAGFWLWKPYFLLKTMKEAPEGAIIVYADSPVVFIKPIQKFADLLVKNDVLLLTGTKRKINDKAGETIRSEVLNQFNLKTEEIRYMDSLWACLVMVKNSEQSRRFIQKWLELCEIPENVMDAPTGLENQFPEFKGHVNDQAMLFVTWRIMQDRVALINTDDIAGFIKNVHRHSSQASKSLLPDIVGVFKISEWGYNSRWMIWLREKFSSSS